MACVAVVYTPVRPEGRWSMTTMQLCGTQEWDPSGLATQTGQKYEKSLYLYMSMILASQKSGITRTDTHTETY